MREFCIFNVIIDNPVASNLNENKMCSVSVHTLHDVHTHTGGMVPFPKDCVRVKDLYVAAQTQEKRSVSESQQQHN